MINTIENASHIVLVAHEHPDADSLGAASAFYSYLLRLNKKITFFCSTQVGDPKLAFLPWSDKIKHVFPLDADLAISFDCGDYKRLGISYKGDLINFDHHISNESYGTFNCIDSGALSTTQVVYEWFIENGIKINAKMAQSLYAGLLDDTGSFSEIANSPKVLGMAQLLIEYGANHEECYDALFRSHSLASFRLKGIMLQEMKILLDGQIALFEVTQEMLAHTGAVLRDCKEVVDDALNLKTVKVAVLVAKLRSGGVKISLRSDGIINASEVMRHYGGGGHASRAGARLNAGDLLEASNDVIEKIKTIWKRDKNETSS